MDQERVSGVLVIHLPSVPRDVKNLSDTISFIFSLYYNLVRRNNF